jgi:hypothetical protein
MTNLKENEGSNHGQYQNFVPEFTWRDRREPHTTYYNSRLDEVRSGHLSNTTYAPSELDRCEDVRKLIFRMNSRRMNNEINNILVLFLIFRETML